jgi:hypothetical protein
MLLETLSVPFQKAHSTNPTDTSFPSKIPTGTEPSGTGVINLGNAGAVAQNGLLVVPYGVGDDNDVFAMRVIGWRSIGKDPNTRLWIPVLLAELTCTLCTAVGVAGKEVVDTERFCDTLALVTGNDDISIDIVSPSTTSAQLIAHAVIDVKGFQKVEFTFDMTTGDPTNANCLVAQL